MAQILVPSNGLLLAESPLLKADNDTAKSSSMSSQAMLLDLDSGVFDEILKAASHGGKGVNVTFGKTITLNYGSTSQRLISTPSPSPNQLYTSSTDNEGELTFAGRLSHKLAMQKAQEETACVDEALEKLQSQLAGYKQDKASNQTKFVQNSSVLPPHKKNTAAILRQQAMKSKMSPVPKKTEMPASPVPYPNSTKIQKLQALRKPLIHFLAARPASSKLLSTHLCSNEKDIEEILHKVGKRYRLDESKWDLHDKVFKELDVFQFDYPNDADRELAIGRGISAFDRLRISSTEKIWEMLMPKHERGKGKILSALNLRKGPINASNTPKIQVQQPDAPDDRNFGLDGNDSDRRDRLAPSDAETGRSRTQGPIKKKRVSEKEAQSKRLLSKGPNKDKIAVKEKDAHKAVKKGGKKVLVPKSSEFVDDSDDEDTPKDTSTLQAEIGGKITKVLKSSGASKSTSATPKLKATKKTTVSKPAKPGTSKPNVITTQVKAPKSISGSGLPKREDAVSKPRSGDSLDRHPNSGEERSEIRVAPGTSTKTNGSLPKKAAEQRPPSPVASPRRIPDVSQGGTAMKRTISRQRNLSSPHKPSPLGSSPPTNASDLHNATSSKSSTHSSHSSGFIPSKTTISNEKASSNGHSRHASEHSARSVGFVPSEDTTPNGITSVNGPRNTSEHTLKRKAGDLDSDIHDHDISLTNGLTSGNVSGYSHNNTKRQKTSEMTPPTSDSGDSPLARDAALKKAADFKKYYDNYKKMYLEVTGMGSPPSDKFDSLMRMHTRLAEMKEQIKKGLAT